MRPLTFNGMLNNLVSECGLLTDDTGQRRTLYSLQCTRTPRPVGLTRHAHVKQANEQQREGAKTAPQQINRRNGIRKNGLKMLSKVKLVTVTATVFLSMLTACGGGGGGGVGNVAGNNAGGSAGGTTATTPTPVVVVDPKIKVYSSFNIANAVLTGASANDGELQKCIPNASQLEFMKLTYDETAQRFVRYIFTLDGNFQLPNASTCSTTGMTGKVTGVNMMADGNPVYALTSLNIDASTLKNGTKVFWENVLKQSGKIINYESASFQINCTDSIGRNFSTPLMVITDISPFFTNCAK